VIEVIILAGGLGTRLRSVLADVPKPMAPVNGNPFLDILMKRLNQSGIIRSVVMALSYHSDTIIDWYEARKGEYSFPIHFSIENEPLGTGGGVRQALDMTGGNAVLVMNGDSFIDLDYAKLLAFHRERSAALTIALKSVEDTSRYGMVEINEADKQISGFREKASSGGYGYINAGVYLFDRNLLLKLKLGIKLSLEHDLLQMCVGDHYFGYVTDGDFIDIGTPETYGVVDEFMRGKI
jgi:D-glycero-alpha-D-manno-heptose 1-phosphate guanylyltransferase